MCVCVCVCPFAFKQIAHVMRHARAAMFPFAHSTLHCTLFFGTGSGEEASTGTMIQSFRKRDHQVASDKVSFALLFVYVCVCN